MNAGGGGRWPDKKGDGSKGNRPKSSGTWRGVSGGGGGRGNGMGGGANGGGNSRGFGSSSGFGGGGSTNGGGSNRGSGGAPAGNICFDFQRTGSCRFGSSCRFLHNMAGSGSSSSGGGSRSSNNAKGNVCFDFINGGSCRFGNNCKFAHSTAGGSRAGSNFSLSRGNQSNLNDSHRLIKQLKNTQQKQLVDAIAKSGDLWTKCWECAASSFSSDDIEVLLHTFANIPFSAETRVAPPPIHAFEGTVRKFLKSSGTNGAKEALLAAETTLNVVRKLLSFEWDDKAIVKNALCEILEDAANRLQRRNADHRDAISRIDKLLDSLEKPWTVREKVQLATVDKSTDGNDLAEESGDRLPYHHYTNWRNATVKWLLYSPTFSPSSNPRMQGPSSKSQGVYKSREQYFDTMQRLMIAMAFSEGHAALAPKCWERSGGQCCGAALVKVSDHEESYFAGGGEKKGGYVICRGRNCNNSASYVCKFSNHGRGLCYLCAARETEQLLGSTGSTHVYNGHVGRVDASGKLYIHSFDSRKPPMDESGTSKRKIHWRSTKRLAVPNLVGVVRLGDSTSVPANAAGNPEMYRALRQEDPIYWGEVCPHGNQSFEAQQRQQGNICINLASRAMFNPDECPDVEHEFKENDVVAIIDCQSFVPEYIPVIRALEQQEQDLLPFDDGVMLNLDANRKSDLTNTVLGADAQNKAAAEEEFQRRIFQQFEYQDDSSDDYDNDDAQNNTHVVKTVTKLPLPLIEKLVSDMISSSTILPLREIRQNPDLASRMHADLVKLMEKATLDFGQLVNFIDALRNPVHVTQGPPGTGKSYLGVQLVHALAIIRKYWIRQNNSVGSPPILVLSYKNHATDEFLVDLLKSMGSTLSGGNRFGRFGGGNSQLVRMGNPGDPSLAPYSGRALAHRADPNVAVKEREVLNLQDLRRAYAKGPRESDMFDTNNASTLDLDNVSKQQSACAYEATEVLYAAIVRSHYIRTVTLETNNTADEMLQSLLSVGVVLNADRADDTKFRLLQKKGHALGKEVIKNSLFDLFEGIKHYIASDQVYDDPYELLYMFLMGQRPKPCCEYKELDESGEVLYHCDSISDWYEVPLCYDHRCDYQKCTNSVSKSGCMFCTSHLCFFEGCDQPRLTRVTDGVATPENELFCASHACFHCVSIGQVPALEALDEPPRNVCENHPLCSVLDCLSLARKGEDYCGDHQLTKCKLCENWAIARDLPYCMHHEFEMEQKKSIVVQSNTLVDSRRTSRRECKGKNKKKKPCKSTAVAGSDFCEAHMPKNSSFKVQQKAREEELKGIGEKLSGSTSNDGQMQNTVHEGVVEPDSSRGNEVMKTISNNSIEHVSGGELQGEEEVQDAIGDEEYGPPPDIDDVDFCRYDKEAEINEGDAAQHIREIFEIESGDEDEDEFQEFEEVGDTFYECQDTQIASGIGASLVDPKDWNWSLSLDDRWAACQAFMHNQCEELERIQELVKRELPLARKRMHEAENRAKARVFENKTVIGGTIVGCIHRLEQIRATRPFAVIVEEASEVMEPLLFACLSQSTVKFQMIGDHLQLQPSLMDKFDFTRINRVNVSMFERLICAPDDHRVPSGVLSVQRRMRKDICDLTREYYTDIVAIEDHPVCTTKVLQGDNVKSTFWQGREIPGVRSHVFLWTHTGAQGRADVGVSKQNKEEAQMCVNLAYYLVKCGVAKASIAILTPYKGQLMLIRKLLLSDQSKARLLTHDSSSKDQVRLSTVDRFQGDESDIVIASLVVDENSRTQFVKLQNRMIVLLSRARLGCFILGNVGYFQGNRRSEGKDAKHWTRTFELLEKPAESSDNDSQSFITVESSLIPARTLDSDSLPQPMSSGPSIVSISFDNAIFTESRVGPSFPLCCPQHPLLSSLGASKAKDLELGFCQIICEQKLSCSHTCGLKCHWPKKIHNENCLVKVDSPCSKHPSKLQCVNVFKNSTASRLDAIEKAILDYKCPIEVTVPLPCGHEENLPCWKEDDIAQSKTSYPTCDRTALSPYVFPDCGHELEVTCSQLELYLKDTSSVKPCHVQIEYYPADCTHTKTIKCYLEKAYRTAKRRYVCPEKVNIALPRCGHEALVTCEKNSQLERYTLAPSECKAELGIVREGITYGEEDHKCNEPSKFIRRCGHEESVTCNKAFQMSKTNQLSPCMFRIPVVHPHCGHVCEVTCSDAESLKAIERLTHKPVDEVQEDDPPFPQNIPRGVGRCTAKVRLHRSCGHIEEVSCGAARGTKPKCKVSIDITSPLCGHNVTVPCWRRDGIQAWRPWSDDVEESLETKSVLPSDAKLRSANLDLPDKQVLDILRSCSRGVEVSKCCGHRYNERCSELVTIISDGGKSKKGTGCSEEVTRELPDCGHKVTVQCKIWQKFIQGSAHIPCNETVEQSCWNAKLCKSDVISVPCSESGDDIAYCCDQKVDWTCHAGLHTYKLLLCVKGLPMLCPQCESNEIASFTNMMKESSTSLQLPHLSKGGAIFSKLQGVFSLDECLRCISIKHKINSKGQTERFFSALATTLGKFQSFQRKTNDPFQQPQYQPRLVPMFYVIPQQNNRKDSNVIQQEGFANIKHFIRGETLNGIAIHHFSRENMLSLATDTKGSTKKTLLVGYLFCLNLKVECNKMPTGKTRLDVVRQWLDGDGHDCIEFNPSKGKLVKPLVVWDPAPLYALYSVGPLDSDDIRILADEIGRFDPSPQSLGDSLVGSIFEGPGNGSQKVVFGKRSPKSSSEAASSKPIDTNIAKSTEANNFPAISLQGSWAESLLFTSFPSTESTDSKSILRLHAYSSKCTECMISQRIEHDLFCKMVFVNKGCQDNVYGGKNVLEKKNKQAERQWAKRQEVQPLATPYQMLLALEIAALDDHDRAMKELEHYCAALRMASTPAHPLLLLAFSRIGVPVFPSAPKCSGIESAQVLSDFARLSPSDMVEMLLTEDEKEILDQLARKHSPTDSSQNTNSVKVSLPASPSDVWESLKDTDGITSKAMEELLIMTGLRKVKQTAVELFKQGSVLSRMDRETRKLNAPALNYVFYGNPGTGKTTVARLFAEILFDAGLRKNKNFQECSGQGIKDAGIDDFKKKAASAMDGVMFIDEAYALDPGGDKFKGAPIANEMLTLAENERDRLSFILAGYEDEMNDKLFAFNPGFKSRFIEVYFEDFDEEELLTVWDVQREKKKWRESNDQLRHVVVRRLMKMKGQKGFGNARAVRQKLEEACARAMAREDFDSTNLELQIEDAVGENPVNNSKLKAVLKDMECMTGWKAVKERVNELVKLCGQNYERELKGQEALPVFLNRMFLGNPGTGKTTCAKLYGRVLKELGFLSNGEVVFKTAGDLGGQVVGESKQKTISLIEGCRGKVLVIDEAYGLNDNCYGKQALDALVERVQGAETDDIAVLLLGYEEQMLEMLDKQNPGLRRRFAPDQAFYFEDYTNSQLNDILQRYCKEKQYCPTLEFRERALKKLEMQRRSESHFGNAGSVQNLLKEAVFLASKRPCLDGVLRLEAEDVELPGDSNVDDPFADLDKLYGMDHIKSQLVKLKCQFDLADEEGANRPKLGHFVFTGAPGTGKTTVARSVGKMLFGCGLISRPNVVETSGLKLTGEYLGQTKKVVQDQLDKANGGILFIDEAYELGKGQFGSEACSTLVEAMTNDDRYGGVVIIMAGYQADMQSMLDTNQGLKSRFNRFIEFRDWEVADCIAYFKYMINERNLTLQSYEQSTNLLQKGFSKLKPLKGWGNARDVVKLFESVLENRAMRLYQERSENDNDEVAEQVVTESDVSISIKAMVDARMGTSAIQRQDNPNSDPFAELDKLYRMDEVKNKLQQLQNTYLVAQHDGEDPPPLGHFIFVGSPGTGKTTVARVMSKILFDLGLIGRNHVEETTGLEMQGQYLGQTKKVVECLLDKAKGGVLFIDEAYTLGQGMFGSEACDTLVAAMTNPEYSGVVVVIAGYPKDIDDMLRSNAGLKSRFTHTMVFPDWDSRDCVECFINRAHSAGYVLPEEVSRILQSGFEKLKSLDGFGNARDVDATWKAATRHRADRIVSLGTLNESKKSFDARDLKKALDDLINGRRTADGKESLRKRDILPGSFHEFLPFQTEEDPANRESNLDAEWQDEWAGDWAEDKLVDCEEGNVESSGEQGDDQHIDCPTDARDPGVSDAVWAELQQVKEYEQKYTEQCLAEEDERKRVEAELEAQLRAKKLAEEAYRKKMEDLQRQRDLAAEEARKKELIKNKLRAIGKCPLGFVWHQVGGGWRCAGGSHYVSDEELKRSFSFDI